MTSDAGLSGIWSATLTPLDESLTPDAPTAIAYYQTLLEQGCDGLNVLGTTGEAMSLSVAQRLDFMERLAGSGLPMRRMMVGTGAASLADAALLTRRAFECGFTAVLIMPPFFFRNAEDEGIVAFFAALFAKADVPSNGVLLYNFPRMSGVAFHPDLVDRLLREFPNTIVGIKDSSNDAGLQSAIIARHPELKIFPGSEYGLLAALKRGVTGCISGTVSLWPDVARSIYDDRNAAHERTLDARRAALEPFPMIPAVRYLTMKARGDARWERVLPPLWPLTKEQKQTLDASYDLAARA